MKKLLIAGAAIVGSGVAVAQTAQQPMPMHRDHMAGPMTRATVQTHVQAMFAKLDANRDGFITKEETASAKQQLRTAMKARRAQGEAARRGQTFDRIDANHDGAISREEFASAPRGKGMMMRRAGMRGMGGKMFERADANKDGRVSLVEAQQAALAHFDAMDLNRDGTITREERQQARQLRLQRKPA